MKNGQICHAYRLLQAFIAAIIFHIATGAIAAGYETANGKIFDANGQEIRIRGINHYGFNDKILRPQYLWEQGWKQQIADIKSLGFNAVRVPIVPDTLHDTRLLGDSSFETYMIGQDNPASENYALVSKTALQALDMWIEEAERQGLYVILDMHSVTPDQLYPVWFMTDSNEYETLIYDGAAYTEQRWIQDLVFIAQRYANRPHFIGIDLYNEPHDAARWHSGPAQWKPAAENAAAAVLAANGNLLVFVQGVSDDNGVPGPSINWGENVRPQLSDPLDIDTNKLVLTPHTYGPDVYWKSEFSAQNYPANLAAGWDTLFGQLRNAHPVVIGEWGGYFGLGPSGQADAQWQNALVDYMIDRGLCSSFYWTYSANSADTGGIYFHDPNNGGALSVRQDKMALLNRLWAGCESLPAGESQTIFTDAVATAWQLAGWTSTVAIQTQIVKSGTAAVKVVANTWGGASFESRDANWNWTDQSTSAYTRLSFDISAGPVVDPGMSTLELSLDLGWGSAKRISDYVPSFAPGTWYHVEVPISAMNPQAAATFRKIMFQNQSESNLTFYIDNVALIGGSGSEQLQSCARIMPIGDSITRANGLHNGYRENLFTLLQQHNCGVSYVGTLTGESDGVPTPDRRHDGHDSFNINDIRNGYQSPGVDAWLAEAEPDIVLLMIGTNDIAWGTGEDANEIGARHEALIDQIRGQRQGVWIFVASIPPQSTLMVPGKGGVMVDRAVLTQQFNAVIRSNAEARMAAGQRVRFVDVNSVLELGDLYDGIHPYESAHDDEIAPKWAEAIEAALGQ